MRFQELLLVFLALFPTVFTQSVEHASLVIETTKRIGNTDANYICATLDWWPHDKCNYNQCPWGFSSVTNLDLSHPFLANAIQAFHGLRLRLGGSLQDQVLYDVGSLKAPCHPFRKQNDGLFGFSKGCLHMGRWDELNSFFRKTGALITFGLNALQGRQRMQKQWRGNWDSSNAHDFINYTISKGYHISSWEFGNELCGPGVGASVDAGQYAKDMIRLKSVINQLYGNTHPKPLLLAPGGFYDKLWFEHFLDASGPSIVNALTHHIYNLGPGSDPNLISRILNPEYLNKISDTFESVSQTIHANGPWASAWVGEAGGAYNSGGSKVSNAFVDSFWYVDQLGMAAKYNTKVYCRQSLIGGNYGLLDTSTFSPNPDYYSALVWHRLMGRGVLDVNRHASPYLRAYAHCTKERAGGVTLLLINLSNQTRFTIDIESRTSVDLRHARVITNHKKKRSFLHRIKELVSWMGSKSSQVPLYREEYHLTPQNGDLQSRIALLNGRPLQLTENGDIPLLSPLLQNVNSPIAISPLSIKFIVFPNFIAPTCREI
ncbi:unnamed protein product [Cuscuta epithymum]|uniref:Heparanase-like protein 1 n=1 Tax=Cuscuta epithymum TaxID=186058 RepID=A0AAV0EE96_9ASTE|nr:unnamed protein product [Cuscuta epithymum]